MVTLRNYQESDKSILAKLANNQAVSRYLTSTFPFPYTVQDADWWINTGAQTQGATNQAIEFNGQFVGSIGVAPQEGWKSHSAEIGYWIGQPYWRKGIATLALEQMTRIAFARLNFQKLFATVLYPNTASIRVLEKCGYRREGTLTREVFKDGSYFDVFHYAKLRIE